MKIALLSSAYHPHVGGVEELIRRLAARLIERDDLVEIWTVRHPSSLPPTEIVDGVLVRRFTFPLPTARATSVMFPTEGFQALTTLSRAVREFEPDVLHVQCFSAQGIYAVALAARHHLPLVVTLHGETVMDDGDIYERSVVLRMGLRLALRRARAVTGCSAFVIDDAVRRFGLPRGKGLIIHNGVEVAGDEEPRSLDLPFERFVFALGRLVPKKGFDLLIEAFADVASKHRDVGLVVGGDGPVRSNIIAQTHALGIENSVVLPGPLGRAEVSWAMAHAEVFVLPSRVEPFGIVVLEAMRAELPVVVSARGGATEIVRHGREGLVADPLDTAALASAIASLLENPALAHRLASAGRRRVQDFAWSRITEQYASVYRKVYEGP